MKKLIIFPLIVLVISMIVQVVLFMKVKTPQGHSVIIISFVFTAFVFVLLLIVLFHEIKKEKLKNKIGP